MSPTPDPRISAYLTKNREWATMKTYQAPIAFKEMQKKGREREDGTVIVLACTDPRTTPEEFLGMDAGSNVRLRTEEATVVRVAGGRVHAAMSTLLVLSAVGNHGQKGVIMIIHHTDCGLIHTTDAEISGDLKTCAGVSEEEKSMLDGMRFGSFEDPETCVRKDVESLRREPYFKGVQIVGFVQDTETGILKEIIGLDKT